MYAIKQTRHFYGPSTETMLYWTEFPDVPELFATRAEAVAAVDQLDGEIYHTSHNESDRPTYRVVKFVAKEATHAR